MSANLTAYIYKEPCQYAINLTRKCRKHLLLDKCRLHLSFENACVLRSTTGQSCLDNLLISVKIALSPFARYTYLLWPSTCPFIGTCAHRTIASITTRISNTFWTIVRTINISTCVYKGYEMRKAMYCNVSIIMIKCKLLSNDEVPWHLLLDKYSRHSLFKKGFELPPVF